MKDEENIPNNMMDQFKGNVLPSKHLDNRVLESARLWMLAKDLGELFTKAVGSSFKADDETNENNESNEKDKNNNQTDN